MKKGSSPRDKRIETITNRNSQKKEENIRHRVLETKIAEAGNRVIRQARTIDDAGEYSRSLFEASLDPIFSIDLNGKISRANNAAVAATGYPREKLIGTQLSAYFTDRKKVGEVCTRVYLEHEIKGLNLKLRHKDGHLLDVLCNATVYRDSAGAVIGAFVAMPDITDLKNVIKEIETTNKQLMIQAEELKKTNKELETFSYSISHDLQTPLRAIDGFSQAILDDYASKLDETGRDYLARVRAAAQRMGLLIDDMLIFSRATQAKITISTVDISSIACQIIEDLKFIDSDRKCRVKIHPGLTADADPVLIRQVIENLLGNAWKFTGVRPDAIIEFGLDTSRIDDCFFVKDNGVGFDMKYADKLFAPFQRMQTSEGFPGAGIGLATVARIINRHHGSVWADSEPGQGATFYFTLPTKHQETKGRTK